MKFLLFYLIFSMVHEEDSRFTLRIGSLILHSVGQLLPHQIQTGKFHSRDCIYPVSMFLIFILLNSNSCLWLLF